MVSTHCTPLMKGNYIYGQGITIENKESKKERTPEERESGLLWYHWGFDVLKSPLTYTSDHSTPSAARRT